MPVYSVEGKLGTGKTKFAVWMAQAALREGRRVASNVDLMLEHLTPERVSRYVRIPDKPDADDMVACGHGNPDSYDEDRNGVMILDELGTWLNSRTYQDKSRAGVLDFLIHARKLGWDVFLIVQDAGMIDKQVREALIEYQVRCIRLDKVRIPVLGHFLDLFGKKAGYLPRMHVATARVGYGENKVIAERWTYRGDDLHKAYDTRQVFTPGYPHGAHSVLPPWDFVPATTLLARMRARLSDAMSKNRHRLSVKDLKPKLPVVAAIARALPPDERIRHLARLERLGLLKVNVPTHA